MPTIGNIGAVIFGGRRIIGNVIAVDNTTITIRTIDGRTICGLAVA